jgi:queuine tRNA-ribosyltransferase
MGVGYPLDLVVCVALGVDMFDCVYPTRTARFGVALVPSGTMRLKAREFATQLAPVDDECECSTCKQYTRAFLHIAFKENVALAAQALTIHNIAYMMRLMRTMRDAILEGAEAFEAYVRAFILRQFPEGDIPAWVVTALSVADIDIRNMVKEKLTEDISTTKAPEIDNTEVSSDERERKKRKS